jgi:hypothetical protein
MTNGSRPDLICSNKLDYLEDYALLCSYDAHEDFEAEEVEVEFKTSGKH